MTKKVPLVALISVIRNLFQITSTTHDSDVFGPIGAMQLNCVADVLQRVKLDDSGEASQFSSFLSELKAEHSSVEINRRALLAFGAALHVQILPKERGSIVEAVTWTFRDLCKEYSRRGERAMSEGGRAKLALLLDLLKEMLLSEIEVKNFREIICDLLPATTGTQVSVYLAGAERILTDSIQPSDEAQSALEKFAERKKQASQPGYTIDDSKLLAGAPMHFYCQHCGILSDTLPEEWDPRYTTPSKECDDCKNLVENGLMEQAKAQ